MFKTVSLNFVVHHFVKNTKFQKAFGQRLDIYKYFNGPLLHLFQRETNYSQNYRTPWNEQQFSAKLQKSVQEGKF